MPSLYILFMQRYAVTLYIIYAEVCRHFIYYLCWGMPSRYILFMLRYAATMIFAVTLFMIYTYIAIFKIWKFLYLVWAWVWSSHQSKLNICKFYIWDWAGSHRAHKPNLKIDNFYIWVWAVSPHGGKSGFTCWDQICGKPFILHPKGGQQFRSRIEIYH